MSAVLPLLWWYAVVQLAGLASWPIAWRLFSGLPDRGYSFTKHLGVLLSGLALWLGNAYGLLPNNQGGAWLSLALVAAAGIILAGQDPQGGSSGASDSLGWLRTHLRCVIWAEALFVATFFFWAWVRACDPAISHTEQPMDLMFMSAVHTSPDFPPRDAWFAGYPVTYYYLGYWLLSTLAFLAGQTTEVAYNLGQASWFALLALGSFGIGSNLVVLARQDCERRENRTSLRWPAAGLLSAAAVALVGNLEFWLEWLSRRGFAGSLVAWFDIAGVPGSGAGLDDWWWWRSSRVLRDQDLAGRAIEVIDEFPFFSYLLGDNHPHLLSMPFLLLLMGMALNHLAAGRRELNSGGEPGRSPSPWRLGVAPLSFAAMAVTMGGLALINSWDLLPAALIVALTFVLKCAAQPERTVRSLCRPFILVSLLCLSTIILAWPFLVSAQSQVTGLRPNLFHPTRFAHFALMFGTILPGVCVLLWFLRRHNSPALRDSLSSLFWVSCGAAAALVSGITWAFGSASGRSWLAGMAPAPQSGGYLQEMMRRWAGNGVTLLLILLCLAGALALLRSCIRGAAGPAVLFTLVLVTVGMSLVCMTELCYLQDSFGTRMNTVFKLYYQAWLLFAVSAAFGSILALDGGRRGRLLASFGILALVAGMAYPIFALYSKTGRFRPGTLTFCGIAHWSQDELAALRWLRANVPENAIIAEAAGASYHADTNRMSAASGRATILGWQGHEAQWRRAEFQQEAENREQVLKAIYRFAGGSELLDLMRSWKIDFLYLGPAERNQYGITTERERELQEELQVVFSANSIKIYRLRGSAGAIRPDR